MWTYDARASVAIAPWEFPAGNSLTGMTAAAVVAGNTVDHEGPRSIVVADRAYPMDAYARGGCIAGRGELSAGCGGRDWAGVFVNHPDVAMKAFTGRGGVGDQPKRESMPREGQTQIKRILTELGGKNGDYRR